MNDHFFDEFNPITISKWLKQVQKDLRNPEAEMPVVEFPFEGFSIPAYFAEGSALAVPRHPRNTWKFRAQSSRWKDQHWQELADGFDEFELNTIDLHTIPDEQSVVINLDDISELGNAISFLEKRKSDSADAIAFDPLAQAVETGSWKENSAADLARLEQIAVACEGKTDCRRLLADARAYGNAGASAIQELTYMAAHLREILHVWNDKAYLKKMKGNSLEVRLSIGSDYLLETAKFRAARLIIDRILCTFGMAETNAFNLHAEPNGLFTSSVDTDSNLLRLTTACMSAILGGCQSVSLKPYNMKDDVFGHRISRNISLLLRHEAHFDFGQDAVAGSYFLDELTRTLAEKGWKQFQELESQGGLIRALENNSIQKHIHETANKRIERFKRKKDIAIGINKYQQADHTDAVERISDDSQGSTFQSLRPLHLEDYMQ